MILVLLFINNNNILITIIKMSSSERDLDEDFRLMMADEVGG